MELRQFAVPLRFCLDQRYVALLRENQQHVLIFQQDKLAVAVATPFPDSIARSQVDAGQHSRVESVDVAAVAHEVVKVGLQGTRLPNVGNLPATVAFGRTDSVCPVAIPGADQDIPSFEHGRLHHSGAVGDRPRVIPKHGSRARVRGSQPCVAHHQHQIRVQQTGQLGRAVAVSPRLARPHRVARGPVVSDHTRFRRPGEHNDNISANQRRTGKTPRRNRPARVARDIP